MDSTQSRTSPTEEQRTLHSDIEMAIPTKDITRPPMMDGRVNLLPNHEDGRPQDIQIIRKGILFSWLILATLIEVLAAIIFAISFFLAIPESPTTCEGCVDDVFSRNTPNLEDCGQSHCFIRIGPYYIANWAIFVVEATLTILITATFLIYCAVNIWDCCNRQKYEGARSFTLPALLIVALVPMQALWNWFFPS